jgi:hypothetical protein
MFIIFKNLTLYGLKNIIKCMIKRPNIKKYFLNNKILTKNGLNCDVLHRGISYTYRTLGKIESSLTGSKLPEILELSNLSSIIGNFLALGIIKNSKNFERSKSHQYQDLRSKSKKYKNIEIKMSLEKNPPKAHLAKEGYYLTCRYVLGNEDGTYSYGKRGNYIWIWEIRFGYLNKKHFNISNTINDSGKTAVVNSSGMKRLIPVFFNPNHCPYGKSFCDNLEANIRVTANNG